MATTDFSGIRARYEDALNQHNSSEYLQRNQIQTVGVAASQQQQGPVSARISNNMGRNFGNAALSAGSVSGIAGISQSAPIANLLPPSTASRNTTPNGVGSSNQSVTSQSVGTLRSNRTKQSQKSRSSSQSVVTTQSKSPSVAAQSTQSASNRKSLRTQPCGATVVNLKQYQHAVEERLTLWIDELQERSNQRQSDYRECDMLIQHSCRLMNRYKRLTCLTIEALLELDHEIDDEEKKHIAYTDQVKQIYEKQIPGIQQEMNSMRNLMALLQHFIQRAEEKKQQQELILQQQLQQQAYTLHSF